MSTVDISYCTIVQQRKLQMLFNTPVNRYNPVSPYVQYPNTSKMQFDMRRKAEILQYTASKSNTKTNNFTKAEKWAQMVNGYVQTNPYNDIIVKNITYEPSIDDSKYSKIPVVTETVIKYPDTYITTSDVNGNITNTVVKRTIPVCDIDAIPTPTSSSDVPGPVINLIKDNSIPLYNYATRNNNYGIQNEEDTRDTKYSTMNDIVFKDGIENTLFSLYIVNNNDEFARTFNFNTPLSLYFQSDVSNSSPAYDISFTNISLSLFNISLNIYYNDTKVLLPYMPMITIPISNTASYDISLNKTAGNNPTYTSYSGEIYIGMLNISNIYLFTQPGYVYTVKLQCNMNYSAPNNGIYTSYFTNIQSGVLCNATSISKTQTNCKINTNPSIQPNTGFSLY
uniref:Uncharacterized protein n=1 Tax=viral metagenome TaxID=1070528 RepID=A0A6C0LQ78_9ZZZZ